MIDGRCSAPPAANSLLCTVHSFTSRWSECIFDWASSARAGAVLHRALLVDPCGAVRIFITFRGRREGNLVLWRSKVDFSWQVPEIGLALLRCADFVAGAGCLCYALISWQAHES